MVWRLRPLSSRASSIGEPATAVREAGAPGREEARRGRPEAEGRGAACRHQADPFQSPPFEKLVGDLRGACSRRINIQHRLVYQVLTDGHAVKVLKMWTHYE